MSALAYLSAVFYFAVYTVSKAAGLKYLRPMIIPLQSSFLYCFYSVQPDFSNKHPDRYNKHLGMDGHLAFIGLIMLWAGVMKRGRRGRRENERAGVHISRVICLLLVISLLMLTSCYDQREIDDMAYPIAMGLDVGHANVLRMTLQLAAPLSIGGGGAGESGGGGGGGGGKPVSVITLDTPSIYSGLNMVNNIISKEINMSHAKVIVISKELAEKGVNKYIQAMMRGREFRPDMFVVVTNDPPDVYLKEVSSVLESNPAKYYELLLGKDYSSYYPETRISVSIMPLNATVLNRSPC